MLAALLKKEDADTWKLAPTPLPLLALLISGGHTELVLMKSWFEYTLVGGPRMMPWARRSTRSRACSISATPGGPRIAALADIQRTQGGTSIIFPRPLQHDNTCDFSFSGLKTAVLYHLRTSPAKTDA